MDLTGLTFPRDQDNTRAELESLILALPIDTISGFENSKREVIKGNKTYTKVDITIKRPIGECGGREILVSVPDHATCAVVSRYDVTFSYLGKRYLIEL